MKVNDGAVKSKFRNENTKSGEFKLLRGCIHMPDCRVSTEKLSIVANKNSSNLLKVEGRLLNHSRDLTIRVREMNNIIEVKEIEQETNEKKFYLSIFHPHI